MALTDKFGGELCANFTIPITATDIELYFHALLTSDYMSSRSSFAKFFLSPSLINLDPSAYPSGELLGRDWGLLA